MKRQYSKPSMSVEMFEAKEYIASCVKISCNKPNRLGVFYKERNYITGYQELSTDRALSICGGTFEVKEDSIKRDKNLYYDSNGTIPGGTVSEAYYFTTNNGEKHYFLKTDGWDQTKTSAS